MNLTYRDDIHEYRIDGVVVPSVTQIIKEAGFSDYSMVPAPILKAAQKFGKAVHSATELWDKGILDVESLSAPLVPYLEAWKKFRTDYNPVINEIELKLGSEKWRFAGTIDRIITLNGAGILDLKSGFEFIPATAIQTGGYGILAKEKYKIKFRMGLLLKPDGTYKIQQYKETTDEQTFLSALICYRWKEKHNLLKKDETND